MASVYDDIRAALEVRLAAVSGIPAIAYENVSFQPHYRHSIRST